MGGRPAIDYRGADASKITINLPTHQPKKHKLRIVVV
jgi:hypothetical protein